jgi:hypothetical protein
MLNAQITIVAISITSTGRRRRISGSYPQAPAAKPPGARSRHGPR